MSGLIAKLNELQLRDEAARIARAHGASLSDVASGKTARHIAAARRALMCFLKARFPEYSTVVLGEIFERDPTSVRVALGKAARMSMTDTTRPMHDFARQALADAAAEEE